MPGDVLEMYRNVWDVDTFRVSQIYQQYGLDLNTARPIVSQCLVTLQPINTQRFCVLY